MTKPFKHWKVLPHGKLKQIDDDILTVTGDIHMPLMDLPRRTLWITAGNPCEASFTEHRLDWSEEIAVAPDQRDLRDSVLA